MGSIASDQVKKFRGKKKILGREPKEIVDLGEEIGEEIREEIGEEIPRKFRGTRPSCFFRLLSFLVFRFFLSSALMSIPAGNGKTREWDDVRMR